MNFEQEYQLEQFRELQSQYFDEDGNCYTGVNLSPFIMESMLKLINVLSERQTPDKANDTDKSEVLNIPFVVCSNCPRTIGLTVGKKYEQLAKHKDLIALVNDYGDFKAYNVCLFE
jgi:hypothetical protein